MARDAARSRSRIIPWDIDVDVRHRAKSHSKRRRPALAVDDRIVNSEGARRSPPQRGCQVYGNSHGFLEASWGTRHSTSCAMIAADGNGMQPRLRLVHDQPRLRRDSRTTLPKSVAKPDSGR